ncbi:MAG TPA: hypothetical protein VGR13_03420 [Actinomycetota bacterium]|jgi:hypothetical protein|nr:hypothetical protein [Actinomycetota bacterium]
MAGLKFKRWANLAQLGPSNFAFSAGFGSTAAATLVAGCDTAFKARITASGTGQGANPTVTITFNDPFAAMPIATVTRGSATHQLTIGFLQDFTNSTAAKLVLVFNGTPTANDVYEISVHCQDAA